MTFKSIVKLMDIKTLVAGLIPVTLGSVYSKYAFQKLNIFYFILSQFQRLLNLAEVSLISFFMLRNNMVNISKLIP